MIRLPLSWCGFSSESGNRGERDLGKTAPDTCSEIDRSMDGFIKPLTGFAQAGRADEVKEQAAYRVYLDSLSAAD